MYIDNQREKISQHIPFIPYRMCQQSTIYSPTILYLLLQIARTLVLSTAIFIKDGKQLILRKSYISSHHLIPRPEFSDLLCKQVCPFSLPESYRNLFLFYYQVRKIETGTQNYSTLFWEMLDII